MRKFFLLAALVASAFTISTTSVAKADHLSGCGSSWGGGYYGGYDFAPSYSYGYAPVYTYSAPVYSYGYQPYNSYGYAYPSSGFYYSRPGLGISIGTGYGGYGYGYGGYGGYGHHRRW